MNIIESEISDRKAQKDYAYALLDKVEIDRETADRKVLRLFGDEQQRVGKARAFSYNPDVIIPMNPRAISTRKPRKRCWRF